MESGGTVHSIYPDQNCCGTFWSCGTNFPYALFDFILASLDFLNLQKICFGI